MKHTDEHGRHTPARSRVAQQMRFDVARGRAAAQRVKQAGGDAMAQAKAHIGTSFDNTGKARLAKKQKVRRIIRSRQKHFERPAGVKAYTASGRSLKKYIPQR